MATRLYLPSTGAAAVSPAYAGWDDTGQAGARRRCVKNKIGSAMETLSLNDWAGIQWGQYLWRQYVSDPLASQTIGGTIKGQIRVSEADALLNHDQVVLCVRVFSNDGSTLRGTLLALPATTAYAPANEYTLDPTLTNRMMADGDSLSSVVCQNGDRLVIEIGTQPTTSPGTIDLALSARFGDASASDLPENETATADDNPWVEFSQDIIFGETGTAIDAPLAVTTPHTVVSQPPADALAQVEPGGITAGAAGAAMTSDLPAGTGQVVADSYNPEAVTSQAVGVAPYIVRGNGNLGDVDDATGSAVASPGSWPTGTGTHSVGQTLAGATLPTDVEIDHVIFVARGVTSQDGAYLSNLRLDISGASYQLLPAFPNVTPYQGTGALTHLCGEARSQPQYTKPAGGAWDWASLVAVGSASVKMDRANITTGGHFAEMWVGEIWAEVYGPLGAPPNIIRIKQAIGAPSRVKVTIKV